ncbi:large-conductance mechanosensitive channel protein MscL [Haloechinothrix sp. LS1_15]|uniref:large-conductance mechanosensitive channel protein MscL n=1 Tax=Haloechinothrix sp. LS1_15 TaxID=2652248 RepID=UPI002948848A|nr:large-conductance mechanosensitive channel protein MscL [Haloechinothrix sp. LS1_15]MDV6014301.1 large-conductance mechanosensitive channel protein MscL [Haloechinothrix sp. LS1_15]
MLSGFKEFLMRGNVVDLAVAVVIGTAFTAVVTSFTDSLIQPLITAMGGEDAVEGLGFRILADNPETFVDFGAVLNAAVNLLIVAAVVYFLVVVPMQRVQQRKAAARQDEPAEPSEAELLTEIRDLLRQRAS